MTKIKYLGFKVLATAIFGLSLIGCSSDGEKEGGEMTHLLKQK